MLLAKRFQVVGVMRSALRARRLVVTVLRRFVALGAGGAMFLRDQSSDFRSQCFGGLKVSFGLLKLFAALMDKFAKLAGKIDSLVLQLEKLVGNIFGQR